MNYKTNDRVKVQLKTSKRTAPGDFTDGQSWGKDSVQEVEGIVLHTSMRDYYVAIDEWNIKLHINQTTLFGQQFDTRLGDIHATITGKADARRDSKPGDDDSPEDSTKSEEDSSQTEAPETAETTMAS